MKTTKMRGPKHRLGDGLTPRSEQRRFERLCEEMRSSLTATGLTSEDVLATIPEARKRVYSRRYGAHK